MVRDELVEMTNAGHFLGSLHVTMAGLTTPSLSYTPKNTVFLLIVKCIESMI